MSGVPKFAEAILVGMAVELVASAVANAADAARARREEAEAAAREGTRQRLLELERLRDEGRRRGEETAVERESAFLERRDRARATLAELAGERAPQVDSDDEIELAIARERARGQIEAMLAGLRADPMVAQWCRAELAELEREAERAAQGSDPERAALAQKAEAILARARECQEQEERRLYIVQSIREAMRDMGFVVTEPELEHAGVPDSALVFAGVRASGGEVAVSVPTEGDVWYAVDGYPLRVEASAAGDEVSSCDEAEGELLRLHALLGERFGVQVGELGWEGRDPRRNLRHADDLPTSGGADHRRGGR